MWKYKELLRKWQRGKKLEVKSYHHYPEKRGVARGDRGRW